MSANDIIGGTKAKRSHVQGPSYIEAIPKDVLLQLREGKSLHLLPTVKRSYVNQSPGKLFKGRKDISNYYQSYLIFNLGLHSIKKVTIRIFY